MGDFSSNVCSITRESMKALACITLVVTLLGACAAAAEVEGIQDDELALGSATPSSTKAAFAAWYHQIKPEEEGRHHESFFDWYHSVSTSGFEEFNDGLKHRYLNKLEGKFKTKKKSTKKKKASKKASKKAHKSSKSHHSTGEDALVPPTAASVPSSKIPFQEDDDHLIPKRGSPPDMARPARHPLLDAAGKDEYEELFKEDGDETQLVDMPDNPETRRLKRQLSRMEDNVEADEEQADSNTLGDYYGDLDAKSPSKHQKHVEEIETSSKKGKATSKKNKNKNKNKSKKKTHASGSALDLVSDEIAAIGASAS